MTIGIPTFNRRSEVVRLVGRFLAEDTRHPVQLLVIDDGSSDGTDGALRALVADQPRARILRHERNQGYARTYAALFEHCESDYLLVGADDDELVEGTLDALLDGLARLRPALLVSQWYSNNGRMVRGVQSEQRVAPRELFRASHHAPGLVYRVAACRGSIAALKELIDGDAHCALVWPQVIVAASLLATEECWWWPAPLLREGAGLPSGLGPIATVCAGWDTVKSLDEYFESVLLRDVSPSERDAYEAMRHVNANRVYSTLRSGVMKERPYLQPHFDRVARRHAVRLYVKASLESLGEVRRRIAGRRGRWRRGLP